ncbi:hypothetical protein RHECNPAF_930061 [Rhizobium etli CNPAF512]|nr:hypothetical protein RHECNPAF_930061 [Rhizobium etli CNPAF512]
MPLRHSSKCELGGVEMSMMSRSSRANSESASCVYSSMPNSSHSALPRSSSSEQSTGTSKRSLFQPKPVRCRAAIPAPMTPTRNFLVMLSSSASADARGFRLGFERKAADFEDVILRHRRLRAVADVGGESIEIIEFLAAAIDMGHFLAVDEEEVILARPAGNVDVFAQLDITLGTEDGQASIAPGRQRLRCEPVDADVACRSVGAQQHFAEILEGGFVGHAEIADRAGDDLARRRAGIEQELIHLMRGDIDDDAAEGFRIEEPVGPGRQLQAVRADAERLDHLADRAFGDELASLDGGAHAMALGKADRKDPAGLGDGALDLFELREGRDTGLVGHHVLAGFHRPDSKPGAVARDRGNADDIDRRIVEQLFPIDLRRIGIGLLERLTQCRHRGLRAVADELAARGQQSLHVIERMPMVDSDDGKSQHRCNILLGFSQARLAPASSISGKTDNETCLLSRRDRG